MQLADLFFRGSDKTEENEDDADMKKMRASLSGKIICVIYRTISKRPKKKKK